MGDSRMRLLRGRKRIRFGRSDHLATFLEHGSGSVTHYHLPSWLPARSLSEGFEPARGNAADRPEASDAGRHEDSVGPADLKGLHWRTAPPELLAALQDGGRLLMASFGGVALST